MSFMFETRFPQHLTAFAAKEAPLQDDYIDCWDGAREEVRRHARQEVTCTAKTPQGLGEHDCRLPKLGGQRQRADTVSAEQPALRRVFDRDARSALRRGHRRPDPRLPRGPRKTGFWCRPTRHVFRMPFWNEVHGEGPAVWAALRAA
jgi:hypothetical protein